LKLYLWYMQQLSLLAKEGWRHGVVIVFTRGLVLALVLTNVATMVRQQHTVLYVHGEYGISRKLSSVRG